MDWYFILSLILPSILGIELLLIAILAISFKIEEKKKRKELAEKETLKARIEQCNEGLDEDLIKYFNYIADAIDDADTTNTEVSELPTFTIFKKNKKDKFVRFEDGVCIDLDMLKYYNYKVNGGENI